jgi:hypothetical protein
MLLSCGFVEAMTGTEPAYSASRRPPRASAAVESLPNPDKSGVVLLGISFVPSVVELQTVGCLVGNCHIRQLFSSLSRRPPGARHRHLGQLLTHLSRCQRQPVGDRCHRHQLDKSLPTVLRLRLVGANERAAQLIIARDARGRVAPRGAAAAWRCRSPPRAPNASAGHRLVHLLLRAGRWRAAECVLHCAV